MRQSKDLLDVSPEALPKPRWRWRWIGVLLAAVLCFLAPMAYYAWHSSRQLEEALREADRLDPGWRLEELEASRAVVADDQNSAFVLAGARQLLPNSWPFGSHSGAPPAEELELLEKIPFDLVPPEPFQERERQLLQQELAKAGPARAEILKVIDLPHGRYPITYAKDGLSTPLNYSQSIRRLATLLCYEAVLRAQDQNPEGALACCRGIFYVERSIRDEPTLISMLIRWAHQRVALVTLERVLAQGELADPSLAGMQRLLEDEASDPMWLIGMRGERAMMDRALEAIQHGDVRLSELPAFLKKYGEEDIYSVEGLPAVLLPGSVKSQRAALLRWNNRMVEIAKLPVEEQKLPLTELDSTSKELPILARAMRPTYLRAAERWFLMQVSFRCMITLLAVERYRLAHGRWPEKLADLVPAYLSKVPIDVYDGAPLRYRAFSEGVTVYSVGMDGIDDGGNLGKNPKVPGTDSGYRLWDVKHRRKPAAH
jgi:hypothetical protein